jgi:uncharacterized protein YdhG (YjbR/CyaY superfamily)
MRMGQRDHVDELATHLDARRLPRTAHRTETTMATTDGFSTAERAAMKQRAEELKAEKGGRKKVDDLQAALDAIAEMPDDQRQIAERVHAIVTRVAPKLYPRTWYGFPAYAHGKDVVCFFKCAAKFDSRYNELGFTDVATLDDGPLWPSVFAIVDWNDAVAEKVERLVRKAVKGLSTED